MIVYCSRADNTWISSAQYLSEHVNVLVQAAISIVSVLNSPLFHLVIIAHMPIIAHQSESPRHAFWFSNELMPTCRLVVNHDNRLPIIIFSIGQALSSGHFNLSTYVLKITIGWEIMDNK